MNLTKLLKSRKGMAGAVAGAMLIGVLALAFVLASVSYVFPVYAEHTSSVTIDPVWVEPETEYEFTLTVTHNYLGGDAIREVRIYNDTLGHTDFECGIAPSGWWLIDQTGTSNYCQYQTNTNWLYYLDSEDFTFKAKMTEAECTAQTCMHDFRTATIDIKEPQGEVFYNLPEVYVDCFDPETTKTYGTPYKAEPKCVAECESVYPEKVEWCVHKYCTQWITTSTPVTLTATDDTSICDSGVDKIYWANNIVDDDACWNPDKYCYPVETSSNEHEGNTVTFYKEQESCHLIQYYAVDKVGNVEELQWQCVFVDDTPPLSVKTHGTPLEGDEGFDWVTQETQITLDCDDSREGCDSHPVKQETLCYRISLHDEPDPLEYLTLSYCTEFGGIYDLITEYCCVYVGDDKEETKYPIHFLEDSYHNLEYYCIDHLGNDERDYNLLYPPEVGEITQDGAWIQWYKVDSVAPTIEKNMFGNYLGDCPSGIDIDHGDCYVADDGTSGVDVTVTDGGEICAIDNMYCFYKLYWEIPDPKDCPGSMVDSLCVVDEGDFSETAHIVFEYDSTHHLYIYCEDELGNFVDHMETFLVDSTPPVTTKTYGQPQKVEPICAERCQYDEQCMHELCTWWITGDTPVTLTSYDEKVGKVYEDEIYWRNTLLDDYNACWEPSVYCQPLEDDITGKLDWSEEDNNPYYQECDGPSMDPPYGCWASASSPVSPGTVGGSIAKGFSDHRMYEYSMPLSYLGVLEGDMIRLGVYTLDGKHKASHRIANHRPSTHQPSFPWTDTTNWPQYVLKDDGMTITVDGDLSDWSGATPLFTECDAYDQKTSTNINHCFDFYATVYGDTVYVAIDYTDDTTDDVSPTGAASEDGAKVMFSVGWKKYVEPFKKPEDSCHLIEYFAVDALENQEELDWQCVFVDNKPPISTKIHGEPYIEDDGFGWVNQSTKLQISCADQQPHPVAQEILYWRFSKYTDGFDGNPTYDPVDGWYSKTYEQGAAIEIQFPDDCWHDIEYYCEDHLGNAEEVHRQLYIVDSLPPKIVKTVGDPKIECTDYEGKLDCYQIDTKTEIWVDAYDQQPHPVNDVWCEWKYLWNKQEYGPYHEEDFPFRVVFGDGEHQESEHELYIYCEDDLGNSVDDTEMFVVDKTPPETTKWYDGPQYSEIDYFHTTTGDQEVDISVEDLGDSVKWTIDFPIDDDTCNGLMAVGLIVALDGEGNGPVFQIHNNDGTDATYNWGTWLYSPWGPTIGDGWFGWHSGDTNTPVTDFDWVEATGGRYREGKPDCPEPNPNGIFTITIDKSELGMDFHWALYTAIGSGFCSHAYQQATYPNAFVWNEPIVSSTNYEYVEGFPKWITSETEVWLDATDDVGPHGSGVAKTFYRDVYLPDENDWKYCEENCAEWENDPRYSAYGLPTAPEPYNPKSVDPSWEEWTGTPFYKSPESCHIIEYYSYDNVEKVERPKWQCVFVDDTAPEPVKEVGDPHTKWDGADANFYDIKDLCWNDPVNPDLECWKVTLLTPITLDCIDPVPHPVDHEETCFNVEWDGEDITEKYCEDVQGYYDKYGDGFCCGMNAPYEFYFGEETEHELEYYCVDALDNIGEIDAEKFKVEGTSFEIQLNKKWNLISVPFVMLDDSIEEVFKDVEDIVKYVWAYDSETGEWYVYVPGDGGTLEEMTPGWGYWVKALEPTTLTIGGSLFSPIITPPDKPVVHGWNLVGYYGTEGQEGYYGPEGNGKEAYCALYSLGEDLLDKEFTALVTYWELDNPNQWKYLDLEDNMDPGAGYWLSVPMDGIYSFTTTCGGFI